MDILVGYTGFVGRNLNSRHRFTRVFNSKTIKDAYGLTPNLCVYSGVRAEKFRADNFPDEDLAHIREAIENIRQISPKKLVLISTVDVIPSAQKGNIYEDTIYDTEALTPYGQNRLFLENEVRRLYPHALIIRLPALFGHGLKKNFIYDMINYIPAMLRISKFEELYEKQNKLSQFYKQDSNDFFRLNLDISSESKGKLKEMFKDLGFSALNFTDSRSQFAFYNLDYLWEHIQILINEGIPLANIACEPVLASELHQIIFNNDFVNEISNNPFDYRFFRTQYVRLFGGRNGYIFTKERVISEIKKYVESTAGRC